MDHNLPLDPLGQRDPEFANLREQFMAHMTDITVSDDLIHRTMTRIRKRRLRARLLSAAAACVVLAGISIATFGRMFPENHTLTRADQDIDAAPGLSMLLFDGAIDNAEAGGQTEDLRMEQQLPAGGGEAESILGEEATLFSLNSGLDLSWYPLQAHITQVLTTTGADVPADIPHGAYTILAVELLDVCDTQCGRPVTAEVYIPGFDAQALLAPGQEVLLCTTGAIGGYYLLEDYQRQLIPLTDGLTAPLAEDAYIPGGLTAEEGMNQF